ncbi:hypothetical protein V5O48_005549 [Marasmius crinis-equi]|uniref:Uncharacterized protein n=1 Tax=Marasmius crinis-equi TaxID=585013 RepID=A0ABR3FM03_9AGAR
MFLRLEALPGFDADQEFVDMARSRCVMPDGDGSTREMEKLRTVEFHVKDQKLCSDIYKALKWIDSDGMMISVFGDGEQVM